MQTKYWVLLIVSLVIVLFFLLIFEFIIFLFPNQQFEITNVNYWILVEILLDASEYNELTWCNQASFIYTIINALLIGMYLNSLGLIFSTKKRNFLIIFIVIYIYFSLFGLFGYRITFNFPILIYKSFQSNTGEGVLFFTLNIPYLLLIYLVSFLIEAEVK